MTAIDDKFAALKAVGFDLGAPTGPETFCPDRTGRFRHYDHGSIYWHPTTGAHEVHGAIHAKWASLGWEESWLGYPRTDEGPAGTDGRISHFQHGDIKWTPTNGAVDQASVTWEAYWNRDAAFHKNKIAALHNDHRMVSLAVQRLSSSSVVYAAVWLKSSDTDQHEIHGVDEAGLAKFLETESAQGHSIELISASGDGADRVWAATTRPGEPPLMWFPRMTDGASTDPGSLLAMNKIAQRNQAVLTSLTLFENSGASWAAGVYRRDPDTIPWSVYETHPTAPEDDMAKLPIQLAHGGRVELTAVSDDQWASLYRDDDIGPGASFSGLTPAEMDAKVETHRKLGYLPRHIDMGGTDDHRFSVIFKKRIDPLPRRLVITGTPVPELTVLDEAMAGYLKRTGIRAANLAVAQDHRLIYARAFTWSAQGYPIAQPQTSFRIGSESKVLTAILIRQLMEDPTTRPQFGDDSKIDHLLALDPPPGMTKTKGFEDITVLELIKHQTAVARNFASFDPEVVAAFGKSLPARSKLDFAAFMMCQPFDPPKGDYRNTNYLFLGALVQKLTGGMWFDALKSRVLTPLGLTLPTPSGSTLARRRPQEVLSHDWNMDLPASLMSADQPLVRSGYGNVNLEEVGDAIGGMAFPSCDLVKVLASFSKTSKHRLLNTYTPADIMFAGNATDGRVEWTHNGGLSNTDALMAIRDDGISWAVTYNAGAPQREMQPDYDELIDAVVDTLPTHDLFPSVGLAPLA